MVSLGFYIPMYHCFITYETDMLDELKFGVIFLVGEIISIQIKLNAI